MLEPISEPSPQVPPVPLEATSATGVVIGNVVDPEKSGMPDPSELLSADKYKHTLRVLELLDSSELSPEEAEIARWAAALHDAPIHLVAQELTTALQEAKLTPISARRIFLHVWWHDFLGKVGEKIYPRLEDLYYIMPDPRDRLIHARLHLADVSSYPELAHLVTQVRERIQSLNTEVDYSYLFQPKNADVALRNGYSQPTQNQWFSHVIQWVQTSTTVLASIVACGMLKSTSKITIAERARIETASFYPIKLAGDPHFLNVLEITTSSEAEYLPSLVTFVIPGSELAQSQTLVCDKNKYLANIFAENGESAGCALPMSQDLYVLIDISNLGASSEEIIQITSLLRLQKLISGEQARIIYIDRASGVATATVYQQLMHGELDVDKNNNHVLHSLAQRVLEEMTDQLMVTVGNQKVPVEEMQAAVEKEQKIVGQQYISRVPSDSFLRSIELLEFFLADYPGVFEFAVEQIKVKQTTVARQYDETVATVKRNGGEYYDALRHLFYFLNGNDLCLVVADEEPKPKQSLGIAGETRAWFVIQGEFRFVVSDAQY